MIFSLKDVELMLLGLPPGTRPEKIALAMKSDRSAQGNHARLRTMMNRMRTTDALDLYRPGDDGAYAVSAWIDTGVLPDGSRDPDYSISSDATRKNHYTTLVTVSTPGKRCDALAAAVSPEARAYFKSRLADVAKSTKKTVGGGRADATWQDIVSAYNDPERMARLCPEDRLIVDFYVMCGAEFPPSDRDYSDVAVSRGRTPDLPGQTYIVLKSNGAHVQLADGQRLAVPQRLAAAIAGHMDRTGWRKRLFTVRTGARRPLMPNTFQQQIRNAFYKLTAKSVGINELVRAFSAFSTTTSE